jgi:hypothetical protein
MVEKEYQYAAALPLSEDFKTLIYRTIDYSGEYNVDTIFPVHQFVMTIDQDGSVIAEQEIACACSPLTIKTATIDSDGVIEVKEIAQTWKEDPLYKGYAGNEVVKQEVKSVTYFKIWKDGKIDKKEKETAKEAGQPQAENDPKP